MSWKMGKATLFQKPPSAPFHCGWTHALAWSLAKSHMFFSGKFCQSFHNTPSFDWRLFCRPPSFGWIRRQMSCFEGSVCHVLFKSFCRKTFLCGWTKLTGQEKKFVGERTFSLCLSPSPRFGWNPLCQVLCLTWGWLKKHSFGQWKNSPKPFSDVGFKQKTWINLGKSHISSAKCHTSWIRVIQPVSEIKAPKSWYGRIGTINIEMLHLDLKRGSSTRNQRFIISTECHAVPAIPLHPPFPSSSPSLQLRSLELHSFGWTCWTSRTSWQWCCLNPCRYHHLGRVHHLSLSLCWLCLAPSWLVFDFLLFEFLFP